MEDQTDCPKPPNRLAGSKGFKNKTLLVTGGTGFMGKVLIEKILRTCPLVKTIYVLVRTKKGRNPQERLQDMFASPLFNLLKQTRGEDIFQRVVPIPADVLELDLGLTEENRNNLAEDVEIIYHLAATIRFDDTLKRAVLLNTRGTKLILQLAKECKKLLVFVHVSTAFSHLHERILYERTYGPPTDPNKVIRLVETLDEDLIKVMTDKIMNDCPNTYGFTKALAEGLVNDEMDKLPIVIARPSVGTYLKHFLQNSVLVNPGFHYVVIPIWKDPLPGWTDSINGPAGLSIACGKGILRTLYCNPGSYIDYLPVDVGASCLMLVAYDYMTSGARRVYHLTTSSEIKVPYCKSIEAGIKVSATRMPLNWAIWFPSCTMTSSKLLHKVYLVLFHYLSAMVLDSLLVLTRNKPILWNAQQRLRKGCEVFEFYWINQWDFNNDHMVEARSFMNETEKNAYRLGVEDFNLEDYFYNCVHAARLYILKEGDETLPTARRHMKMLWLLDSTCKMLMVVGFSYFFLKYFVYL